MIDRLFKAIERWNQKGMFWPFVHDPTTKKPSVTLLFVYVTFLIAAGSVIASHFELRFIPATLISIMFWVLAMVFYRLRRIDQASIDLKNDSISLGDDTPTPRNGPPNIPRSAAEVAGTPGENPS